MSEVNRGEWPFDGQRDAETGHGHRNGMTLHEERLRGGVERLESGRVEVRKRIVVEELTVTLPVRREVADFVRVYDDGSEEVLDLPASHWQPRIEDRTGGMPYGEQSADERRAAAERAGVADEVYDAERDEAARPARSGDDVDFYDVVLHEERPVIATEVFAVERLRLGVARETTTMRYTDTVAREVADFDRDGDPSLDGGR